MTLLPAVYLPCRLLPFEAADGRWIERVLAVKAAVREPTTSLEAYTPRQAAKERAAVYGSESMVGPTFSYAGFWRRFAGLFIDGILVSVVATIVGLPFGMESGVGSAVGVVLGVAYYVYFFTSTGQTLGAKVMGVKVVDGDGNLLTTGSAVVRVLGAWVSSIILGIGYLMMLWDSKNQTLHDKMAGSYVVKV